MMGTGLKGLVPTGPIGAWPSRSVAVMAAAWRKVTRRHLLYTFLLCLAWSGITIATQTAYFSRPARWTPSLNAILAMQFNGFAVLFAVLVADEVSAPPLRRSWPYVVAVLLGVAAGSTLYWLLSQHVVLIGTRYQLRGMPEAFATFGFRQGTHALVFCGLVTWIYACQKRAAGRLTALRTLQLERAATEKRLVESRLNAMQARIDPQFLLDTLAQIERRYEHDVPGADRLLRELAGFLRRAIPQTGAAASTVAHECELANMYLNLVHGQAKDRWCIEDGDGALDPHATRAPPMILLPLIKIALANGQDIVPRAERFLLGAARQGRRLRLTIRDRRGGFAAAGRCDVAVEDIRERLAKLYANDARLMLRDAAEATEAVVDVPYEPLGVVVPI